MTHVTTSPYYPQSNGKIERLNQTIKSEGIRKLCPANKDEAIKCMERYTKDYNEVRLHSSIGYVTPQDRLTGRDKVIQAERKTKLLASRMNREKLFMDEQLKLEAEVKMKNELAKPSESITTQIGLAVTQ